MSSSNKHLQKLSFSNDLNTAIASSEPTPHPSPSVYQNSVLITKLGDYIGSLVLVGIPNSSQIAVNSESLIPSCNLDKSNLGFS